MRTRSRIAVLGAAVGVIALLASFLSPASAAEQDLEMVITGGDLTVAGNAIPLDPGSGGLTGVWDDVTGDFTGQFNVNTTVEFNVPPPIMVGIVITTIGDLTGNIDPATGEAQISGQLNVLFDLNALLPGVSCDLGPININWTTDPPGAPFDLMADPITGALTEEDFSIPGASCSDPALNPVVDGALGLPTSDTSTLVELEAGEIPPPTTTTTTAAPVVPAEVTPAQPVQTQPSFTG